MKIPPNFKDLLPLPLETLRQIAQVVGQPPLLNKLKEAAELVGGKDTPAVESIQQVFQQISKWAEGVANPTSWSQASSMEREGVNGTGEIFASRWTNGVVSSQAVQRGAQLLSHPTPSSHVSGNLASMVQRLTGASEVLVATNTSAALLALALSDPSGRTWLLPRVDSVRPFRFGLANEGSLRAPLDLAQRRVIEVGSSQECSPNDFEQGLPQGQSVILSVSPGHSGGKGAQSHESNLRAGRDALQSTWIEILYNGSLHAIDPSSVTSPQRASEIASQIASENDLKNISSVQIARPIEDRWPAGPDILLVPCDLWLGGPEACLILSRDRSDWWRSLERVLQLQGSGFEASAWTQAVLYQTLRSTEERNGWEESGAGAAATTSLENLRFRAQKLASQLEGATDLESVTVLEKTNRIGMGLWSELSLHGVVLQLKPQGISPAALAERLAAPSQSSGAKPLWCNALPEHVEIVLRTVSPADDAAIVQHFVVPPQPVPPSESESPSESDSCSEPESDRESGRSD